MPQILNVVKAKSADGLSLLSLELDVRRGFIASIAYSVKLSYSLHSYGEQVVPDPEARVFCWPTALRKCGTRGVCRGPRAAHGAGAVGPSAPRREEPTAQETEN